MGINKQGVINMNGSPNPNLAIDSLKNIAPTALYNIANFNTSETLTAGNKYTVVIKGTIGDDKKFGIWLGGGATRVGWFTNNEDGTFITTFTSPNSIGGNGSRTGINIYAYPSSNSNKSSLEWLKLENGEIPTLWIPNVNDDIYVGSSGFIENNDICKIQKQGYIQSPEFIEI